MTNLRYAPDFRVEINGKPVPAALRASISSVNYQSGLDGADRVEVSIVNENLRWLDHDLLALDNPLALSIGYAPDPLKQVFVGEIVGHSPTFPSGGSPMLTVVAHDRRVHLQQSRHTRWFAIPAGCLGNLPMSDPTVINFVSLENLLIPISDPISAALSVVLSGAQVVAAIYRSEPDRMQKLIRKQASESDFDFLRRIAHENGWEMLIDHSDPLGGWKLRFLSLAEHLAPDVTLKYGQSLIDFSPRLSKVGQIAGISVRIWQPDIKMEFTLEVSWDWDRNSLNLNISTGFGAATGKKDSETNYLLLEEPVTKESAPRLIMSKLFERLNQRLTGSGSTIGDPNLLPGRVLRLEGLGQQFSGLWRITSATHTVDSGGYHTSFEVRKEIWFSSIPLPAQGAIPAPLPNQAVAFARGQGLNLG
jgi:phage protein D